MRKIDRLYLKAVQKLQAGAKTLHLAFVSETPDCRYEARCMMWDGKPCSAADGDWIVSLHDTQDEAIEAVHKLAVEYPNEEDVRIIVIDYGEEIPEVT